MDYSSEDSDEGGTVVLYFMMVFCQLLASVFLLSMTISVFTLTATVHFCMLNCSQVSATPHLYVVVLCPFPAGNSGVVEYIHVTVST